jgi:hypothetical protein
VVFFWKETADMIGSMDEEKVLAEEHSTSPSQHCPQNVVHAAANTAVSKGVFRSS